MTRANINLWMEAALKRAITIAAAEETIATGKTVTPSEWVRAACEQRLEK